MQNAKSGERRGLWIIVNMILIYASFPAFLWIGASQQRLKFVPLLFVALVPLKALQRLTRGC